MEKPDIAHSVEKLLTSILMYWSCLRLAMLAARAVFEQLFINIIQKPYIHLNSMHTYANCWWDYNVIQIKIRGRTDREKDAMLSLFNESTAQ